MPDNDNLERFNNWLGGQDRQTCTEIAVRGALRFAPFLTHFTTGDKQRSFLTLSAFRALLTGFSTIQFQDQKISTAASNANIKLTTLLDELSGTRNSPGDSAAIRAASAAMSATATAFASEYRIAARTAASGTPVIDAINAAFLDTQILRSKLLETPLWHSSGQPKEISELLVSFVNVLEFDPNWVFWREWYQGFLDGKPMDWELQKEVALISDDEWEKGPERIAELIEEIQARFELQSRIEELEDELAKATVSRHGIGGNNPPDAIDGAPQIARELVIVWEPLQSLASEAASKTPDKHRIKLIIENLIAVFKKGCAWVGSKGDLAVDTTIKWAIPTLGGYFVLNPDKLATVIEGAMNWIATF